MNNKSFDDQRIALGYAKDRPWLHKLVIERIKEDCSLNSTFQNGLDVGCGAGLSTKALKLLCAKVTGTDISNEMIQLCKKIYASPEFIFYTAKAEETAQPQRPYDIVTAAGVVNWVEKEKFLQNMTCVMAKDALLIIYDFWISDKMAGNEAYTDWYQNLYLPNFPKPPRKEDIWSEKELPDGLTMKRQTTCQMQYEFDMESFVRFMMIQSNVNAQIASKQKTEEEIQNWMEQTLTPIFQGKKQMLVFDGYIWYLQRQS